MITTETLLIKLDVNPKELSKAKIMLLNDLVERYNSWLYASGLFTLAMRKYS